MLAQGYAVTENVELVKELGAGGMGSVWIARHKTLETEVAVKFVSAAADDDKVLKRFSREAALAAQIKSLHVVQTYDHGVTPDGVPYIVMEKLEGTSLEHRIKKGRMSTREVVLVVAQVAKALERAHELGIVHRDLKPANLFLVDSGYELFLKVLDFGIAKRTTDLGADLTDSQAVVGTPFYMSPEALRAKRLDHRTDLWSLAVVAYHALTGKRPFVGETFGDQVMVVHDRQYTKVTEHRPELDASLDDWFAKAFAKDIDDRHQTAKELATSFRKALGQRIGGTSVDEAIGIDGMDTPATGEMPMSAPAPSVDMDSPTVTVKNEAPPDSTDRDESTLEGAATPPGSRTGSSSRTLGIAAAAALVLGAGAWGISQSSEATVAQATLASALPDSVPEITASAPTPAPRPESSNGISNLVAITVKAEPATAEVMLGDTKLGAVPGPFEIRRGTEEIELTVRAEGHQDTAIALTPDGPKEVVVKLPKATPRAPVQPAAPRKPKPSDRMEW